MAREPRNTDRQRASTDPRVLARARIRVVHALPRRVRVRVSALKGNPPAAREIEERLTGISGVRRVEANPATGSVLALFDERMRWRDAIPALAEALISVAPELDAGAIADHLAASPEARGEGPVLTASHVTGFFTGVNEAVRTTSGTRPRRRAYR